MIIPKRYAILLNTQHAQPLQVSSLFWEYFSSEITNHFPSPSRESTLRRIGINIGRRMAHRLTMSLVPFTDAKDAVKFICKDLWFALYRQQASRLQASKRGVYIIHDSNFPRLHTISKCVQNFNSGVVNVGDDDAVAGRLPVTNEKSNPIESFARIQMQMTAGILEGFLEVVGFKSTVDCMLSAQLPACSFQVSILESRSVLSAHSSQTFSTSNTQAFAAEI